MLGFLNDSNASVRSSSLSVVSAAVISAVTLFTIFNASRPVLADAVSIDPLGHVGTINPSGSSGLLTLMIRDLNPSVSASMGGWSVGIAAVPLGGATGSISFTGIGYPASGGIFPSPFPSSAPTVIPDSPYLGATNINASEASFLGEIVPATAIGLFQFTVEASPAASGLFSIQLVDSFTGPITDPADLTDTLWNDADNGFAQEAFLVDGSAFESGIEIGQVQVVPEPSALALATFGAALGIVFKRRRSSALTLTSGVRGRSR
jgi:hypothetical protein